VIKNFCQYWPIYDLPFEVVKDEDEEAQKKPDANDNRGEMSPSATYTVVEEANFDDKRKHLWRYSSQDSYDVIDGSMEQQFLLMPQHPISEEPTQNVEKSQEATATCDEVDIAIRLPSWKPKTPLVGATAFSV